MPRLRFTREEAEAEATRLATEFVSGMAGAECARCLGAFPDRMMPKTSSSKHPVVWVVAFVFHPPDVIVDGGEIFVTVNLQTKVAGQCEA
jgi:hypothetical protein